MSLRDRLDTIRNEPLSVAVAAKGAMGIDKKQYADLKTHIHQTLLDRINLEAMEDLPPQRLKEELRNLVERLLEDENVVINDIERRNLVRDIQYEMLGLGPLEPLLVDPTISDILVNSYRQVYVERRGKLELTDVIFNDDAHLMKIIDKIVSRVGRRVDESSPMVDARLPDGSRVNAIIPPLAIDGPMMSIRRFATVPYTMEDILGFKTLTPEMAEILQGLVKAKINFLISGGTGGGKTTLLNILSASIPHDERIITIEDAAELQLQQPHVIRLETRPPNIEGKGDVTQRALVRNSLRMRPDRIVLGEVRGAEAVDMMQAMNTGHEGSMATIHANTPRDALSRLENMIGLSGMNLPAKISRQQISAALTAIVQVARLTDGRRKVVSIQEMTGMEGDIITMQELYAFKQTGIAKDGTVLGHFAATGLRPKFGDRLKSFGIVLPDSLFDPSRLYE
ncbi:MAG TPA: CpaF family protein [Casimicrobiaceae bacterium]|jgi:pilus assembly protein CpaF|nr:CpaF family protein [Casimicrobiaceae bacterium]